MILVKTSNSLTKITGKWNDILEKKVSEEVLYEIDTADFAVTDQTNDFFQLALVYVYILCKIRE